MTYKSGLYSNHSYLIIRPFKRKNKKYLFMRDPHGSHELLCTCKQLHITDNFKPYKDAYTGKAVKV